MAQKEPEERAKTILANALGITYEELRRLTYEIEEYTGHDGAVLNILVQVHPDSDPAILDKIRQKHTIDSNNNVVLEPDALKD